MNPLQPLRDMLKDGFRPIRAECLLFLDLQPYATKSQR